jgi:hypothetical protein
VIGYGPERAFLFPEVRRHLSSPPHSTAVGSTRFRVPWKLGALSPGQSDWRVDLTTRLSLVLLYAFLALCVALSIALTFTFIHYIKFILNLRSHFKESSWTSIKIVPENVFFYAERSHGNVYGSGTDMTAMDGKERKQSPTSKSHAYTRPETGQDFTHSPPWPPSCSVYTGLSP